MWWLQDSWWFDEGRRREKKLLKFNNLFKVPAQTVNKSPSCGRLKGFWIVEPFFDAIAPRLFCESTPGYWCETQLSILLFIYQHLMYLGGINPRVKTFDKNLFFKSIHTSSTVFPGTFTDSQSERQMDRLWMTIILLCAASSRSSIACLQVSAVFYCYSGSIAALRTESNFLAWATFSADQFCPLASGGRSGHLLLSALGL